MITKLAERSLKIAFLSAVLICMASVLHGAAPEAKPAAEVPLILTPLEQLQQENMQLRAQLATVNAQLAQATYQATMIQLGQSADTYERQTLAAHPGAKYQLSRKGLSWEKVPAEPAAKAATP